ncbi:TRAP transporter small permease [Colwellia hornerae]|uniref:TRAP transporter small permease protein n=1 Tax=Colwellia hornerae TaxID=89402 RepID=A0A5C6QMR3_9GAMM|nr:TRAP transporter small permease [Colwellia hornerae]TWX53713.1 TRAP transporter small permease [Colwellia hornerae]TWX60363.1 TRAP transporter small permease [Colwellia hornerae]TWX70119.1 TRAP transporter small permease [Colwellia hornerae]
MLKKFEQGALIIAGLCIVALGLMITLTVVTRNLFGWGITDDVVIVRELMVGAVFLPLAYVTADYSHITIEFLFKRLGSHAKLWLLAIGSLISLLILMPLAVSSWQGFFHAATSGAYFFSELDLPEWPGRFAFFIGAALFVVRLSIIFVTDIRAAVCGDTKYLVQRTNAKHDTIEEG